MNKINRFFTTLPNIQNVINLYKNILMFSRNLLTMHDIFTGDVVNNYTETLIYTQLLVVANKKKVRF